MGKVLLIAIVLLAFAAPLAAEEPASAHTTVTINVGDNWFCEGATSCGQPYSITIDVGDTVTWKHINSSAYNIPHTVTECGASCAAVSLPATPVFDSRTDPSDDYQYPPYKTSLDPGDTFTFTFDTPGTYNYRCEFHLVQMRGAVTVRGPQQPPPPPPPPPPSEETSPAQQTPSQESTALAQQPSPAPPQPAAPSAAPVAAAPAAGGEPSPEVGGAFSPWAAIVAGLLLIIGGTLALGSIRSRP